MPPHHSYDNYDDNYDDDDDNYDDGGGGDVCAAAAGRLGELLRVDRSSEIL